MWLAGVSEAEVLGERGQCTAIGGKPVSGMDAQLADAVRYLLVIATTPAHEPLLVSEVVARPALEEVLEYLCEAWKVRLAFLLLSTELRARGRAVYMLQPYSLRASYHQRVVELASNWLSPTCGSGQLQAH
jgi:hypothetical protein